MEWPEFQSYSPLGEPFYGFLSSPQYETDPKATSEWTFEENKLFEDALAEFDASSPHFFENVASRVNWKTVDDIKEHYRALVEDVEMIESGNFPVPDYEDDGDQKQEVVAMEEAKKDPQQWSASSSQLHEAKAKNNAQQRRRGVPWTEEEHQLFLMGLNKYGKGDWRSISRYYVITKTPTQVASHAQKYFRRQNSSTPVDRRRPSIHDIQTVNPSSSLSQRRANNLVVDQSIPFSASHGHLPVLNHNPHGGFVDQNPMLLPISSSRFPSAADPMLMNQGNPGAYAEASYMLPSLRNLQWG